MACSLVSRGAEPQRSETTRPRRLAALSTLTPTSIAPAAAQISNNTTTSEVSVGSSVEVVPAADVADGPLWLKLRRIN